VNEESRRRGYVYVMQAGPYFKIGWTASSPMARRNQIQTSNPERVNLLGAVAGTGWDEKQLHRVYAAKRCHGEWFTLSGEDVSAILAHRIRIPQVCPVHLRAEGRTIPRAIRDTLLSLLAAGGTTSSQAAAVAGISKTTAHGHLSTLRAEGVTERVGAGRSSRYVLAQESDGTPQSAAAVRLPPVIPSPIRDVLLSLLTAGGVSSRGAAQPTGVSKTTALGYLHTLRAEGVVAAVGGGRASKFVLVSPPPRFPAASTRKAQDHEW
jgi:transposase